MTDYFLFMALIAMCFYCTETNGRLEYAKRSLNSIVPKVRVTDRLVVINQNSFIDATLWLYGFQKENPWIEVVNLSENIGTAKGINIAIKSRKKGEHLIKCDDDVVWNTNGWVEMLEEVLQRDSSIGIVGCKRKDLAESPVSEHSFYRSEMKMLPHEAGQSWIMVEVVQHVMGTCQMISSTLLDKVGYFFQSGLYGLDDSDMSYRSTLLGFKNVFDWRINIDHIDTGGTEYCAWKQDHAGEQMGKWSEICEAYRNGTRSLYYDGI